MRYLLDTHILLWMRQNDGRLSRARWEPVFTEPENEIFFSVVSLWEIAIKRSLGKLEMEGDLTDFGRTLQENHRFHQLPLELAEISRIERLPMHHGDPFDRLLIAQAIEHRAIAVTNDPKWKPYPVQIRF